MAIPAKPYKIGYTFTLRHGRKTPQDRQVIDHLTTYNSAKQIVRFRYVTRHFFMGQAITDNDVLHITIQRNSEA